MAEKSSLVRSSRRRSLSSLPSVMLLPRVIIGSFGELVLGSLDGVASKSIGSVARGLDPGGRSGGSEEESIALGLPRDLESLRRLLGRF